MRVRSLDASTSQLGFPYSDAVRCCSVAPATAALAACTVVQRLPRENMFMMMMMMMMFAVR